MDCRCCTTAAAGACVMMIWAACVSVVECVAQREGQRCCCCPAPGRGSVSSRRPTRPPLLVLDTGRYMAACTCSHMDTRHALHCSSRLVGAAHLARRGGAAAATAAQLTGAGQLLHPRCGSPPRPPDRPIVDCRTQFHAHARHASSRSSCPKIAGRRPPPRTVPRRLPATSDPDRGTKSCVAARRAPRQGRRASLPAVRCQRCMHDPCPTSPSPLPAAPGWGLLTPAAGLITLQPTPLPCVHRRWRLLMPSSAAGPDPPLQPQPPQPSPCRPSCWRACLSCCPGTCST